MTRARSRETSVQGLRLHYSEWPGDRPTVVLLHGTGAAGAAWAPLADLLAPACRVLALDLKGHGESDKPGSGYALDELGAEVVSFLDALGLPRVDLAGHGYGAKVAAWVAGQEPERVLKLMLIDAGRPDPDPVTDAWSKMAYFEVFRQAPGPFGPDGDPQGRARREAVVQCIEEEAAADLRPLLPGIRAATLVVLPARGPRNPAWGDLIKGARLVFADAPTALLRQARAFLGRPGADV